MPDVHIGDRGVGVDINMIGTVDATGESSGLMPHYVYRVRTNRISGEHEQYGASFFLGSVLS